MISPRANFSEETVVVKEAPRFPRSSALSQEEAVEVWLKRENMIYINSILSQFFDENKGKKMENPGTKKSLEQY